LFFVFLVTHLILYFRDPSHDWHQTAIARYKQELSMARDLFDFVAPIFRIKMESENTNTEKHQLGLLINAVYQVLQ
jgi:hypothetical protein